MLEHDKRIMLLRYDKREWLRGCVVGYRLVREGNHAIKMLVGWEKREDSRDPGLCGSRAGMRGVRKN